MLYFETQLSKLKEATFLNSISNEIIKIEANDTLSTANNIHTPNAFIMFSLKLK